MPGSAGSSPQGEHVCAHGGVFTWARGDMCVGVSVGGKEVEQAIDTDHCHLNRKHGFRLARPWLSGSERQDPGTGSGKVDHVPAGPGPRLQLCKG